MSYTDVINEIKNLPHYRKYTCVQCGHSQQIYALLIQASCEKCGRQTKLRGYAALGSEVEDVIDAVLVWLGTGDEFKAAVEGKQIIDS
jgi:ribosomal protein S27E